MFLALVIIHVLVSIFLVFVVLLQTGRGAELGAAFGGMGQSTYGRGQSTFITKFTTGLAVVFMSTSLSLAFLSSERPTQSALSSQSGQPVQQVSTENAAKQGAVEQTQTVDKQEAAPVEQKPLEQSKAPPKPPAANKK